MSNSATTLIRMPAVRAALGFVSDSNRPVIAACERFNIPVVALSSRMKAIRSSDLETLISRASGTEVA